MRAILISAGAGLFAAACGVEGSAQSVAGADNGAIAADAEAAGPTMTPAGPAPAGPPIPATAQNLPPGAIRMQRAEIVDRQGFEKPLAAMTLLVPVGWQGQGGVNWTGNNSGCGPSTPHFNWTATSPDGLSAVSILPQESWTGMHFPSMPLPQQFGQCPNYRITNGRDFVANYVQRYRPQARMLDYQDLKSELVEAERKLQQMMTPAAGIESKFWLEGGLALVGYQANGRDMREIIGTVVMYSVTRMADGMGGYSESYFAYALPGFGYRAPDGALDFELAKVVRHSAQANPEWSARMAEHHAKIAQINAKGARERSRIIAQSNREISQMQQDSWEQQQASDDRMHREFTEYIGGVETYDDPYHGGTVKLDSTYDHAWQLDDGSYVLTDDPSFDPYRTLGRDGNELQRTP